MKLLFDIGNTRIKWAWSDKSELGRTGEQLHRGQAQAAAFDFLDGFERPDAVFAVNVAGAAYDQALAAAIQSRFGLPVTLIKTSRRAGGVVNGYTAYEQLGADRWAALVGAAQRFATDVCIVDAGTAVTIDLLRAGGQHLGGLIIPGLSLMSATLTRDTSDIAGFVEASRGDVPAGDWFGRDTRTAVQRGSLLALQAVIATALRRLAEYGGEPALVLTGGDATQLLEYGLDAVHAPALVLEGLRVLAAEPDAARETG